MWVNKKAYVPSYHGIWQELNRWMKVGQVELLTWILCVGNQIIIAADDLLCNYASSSSTQLHSAPGNRIKYRHYFCTLKLQTKANQMFAKISQLRRRPLLLKAHTRLVLSHLRHYSVSIQISCQLTMGEHLFSSVLNDVKALGEPGESPSRGLFCDWEIRCIVFSSNPNIYDFTFYILNLPPFYPAQMESQCTIPGPMVRGGCFSPLPSHYQHQHCGPKFLPMLGTRRAGH